MLGYVSGKLISKSPESGMCTVLTGGLGYEVKVTPKLLEKLEPKSDVEIWLHTIVREDAFLLYGFPTEGEKRFFAVLLSASKLGPKTALSLIGEHGCERLAQLILDKNTTEIATAPGVGKKSAERIVLELRPKIEKLAWVNKLEKSTGRTKPEVSPQRLLKDDVSSALVNLGYQPTQVRNTVDALFEDEQLETVGFEAILKRALKDLSARAI